ncbi:Ubiquinone biosynthesis O-methyltransferase [uncultured archaeon]|nr:Ubiquinone biosynthesis O-methyltransferase [uncultured archaeon]
MYINLPFPSLGMAGAVLAKVRDFYESHPYPHQDVAGRKDLLSGEHAKVMKRILATVGMEPDDLKGRRVLDAGCGTGEKAVYCAIHGADVDAFDISERSIGIARKNAGRLGVRVDFSVAAFEDVNLGKKYDLVLCIGTLHHTEDAKGNFMRMARAVAKNGRIALGLYNLYGRLACRAQRKLLWAGEREPQRVLEKVGAGKERNRTWRAAVSDRFGAPHETYHTVEEVLRWFSEAGFAPVETWPRVKMDSGLRIRLSQLGWLLKSRGFFFAGGKKISR